MPLPAAVSTRCTRMRGSTQPTPFQFTHRPKWGGIAWSELDSGFQLTAGAAGPRWVFWSCAVVSCRGCYRTGGRRDAHLPLQREPAARATAGMGRLIWMGEELSAAVGRREARQAGKRASPPRFGPVARVRPSAMPRSPAIVFHLLQKLGHDVHRAGGGAHLALDRVEVLLLEFG